MLGAWLIKTDYKNPDRSGLTLTHYDVVTSQRSF